jgi:hypothetical protein
VAIAARLATMCGPVKRLRRPQRKTTILCAVDFFCIIIEQLRLEVTSGWKSARVADMHGSLMNHVTPIS